MTGKEKQAFEKKLLALEAELSGKGIRKIEPNRTSEAEVGGDEDEQPLNEMHQTIASNRNQSVAGVLGKVRAALKKLADDPDDYGLCEECGDALPKGRLEAMPYADRCVACQSKLDGPKLGPTRKRLTDYR